MDTASFIVKSIKFVFNLYPSFHFSKIFSDVVRIADSHFDTYQNRFISGRPFVAADLLTQRSQSYDKPFPHSFVIPSCL